MTSRQQLSDDDLRLWRRLVEAERAYIAARMELFAGCSSLVGVVRAGLDDTTGRTAALGVAALLKTEERQQLFGDLLDLAASSHAYMGTARALVLSLPRDWVLARIESAAEPLLRGGTYNEYRGLLGLYTELDRGLAERLARRAAAHADEDIREAGEDFSEKLKGASE